MKFSFAPGGADACALYRQFIPHLHLPDSNYVFRNGPIDLDWYGGAKVVVVQRLHAPAHFKAIMIFKQVGMKVVYDLDDNLWDIPTSNPAYPLVKAYRIGFEKCAEQCHMITVSTSSLAVAVRRHMKVPKGVPVTTINNAMDFDLFYQLPMPERDFVKVGWAGTNTHTADVRMVFDVLTEVLKENPHIRLEFIGLPAPERIKNDPRVRELDFVPIGEYPSRLASLRWDIMLAMIEENSFNKSKSTIKMLEAAAAGYVMLASDVGPYKHFCALDRELEYLLCRNRADWKRKIVELSLEPDRRKYLASVMRRVAIDHFDIRKVKSLWHDALDSLC